MTKKNFFLGAGAAVLAVSAAFAGRASVKSSPSSIYVSTALGGCRALTVVLTSANTFTTGGSGFQATIKTAGGNNTRNIWATSTCAAGAKPVHFKG